MMFAALVRNSLRLLLRQKLAWPLFLAAAAGLPFVSCFVFSADGTLCGVLKMMWGWQFYVASGVLMLVTAYLASTVLESEFRGFQMLNTAVKPVSRWTILLAKFAAVCLLSGLGTAVAGGSSYLALRLRADEGRVIELRRETPDTARFSDAERARDAAAQRGEAEARFFTSRLSRYPELPDLLAEVRAAVAAAAPESFAGGRRPTDAELQETVRRVLAKKRFTLPFTAGREFVFRGLPRTAAPLTLRYKFGGTHRQEALGWLQAYWQFSGAADRPPYTRESSFRRNTEQEFAVPGELIGPEGVLRAEVHNISGPVEKAGPAELEIPFDGLRVLLPHGSFGGNFARAWLFLWFRLCLLAAIGVGFSPLVGAPVNGFLLTGVLFIGCLNASARAELAPPPSPYKPVEAVANVTPLDQAKRVAASLVSMLPDFTETDRVDDINGGTEIPWTETWAQFLRDVVLRGGAALVLGGLVFRRRELAIYRG